MKMATSGTEHEARAQADATSHQDGNVMDQVPNASAESTATNLETRADPDAQTTVNDFLDFTEYLPSDMTRSLTLIRKLDQTYTDASIRVNDLTTTWGQLPQIPVEERPDSVKLRADISRNLDQAVSSRIFAHAEAVRMSENVDRHYKKAKLLLEKLKTMMENYPTEAPKSPVATKSPQMLRARLTVRPTDEDGKKMARNKIPRVTVPGEVLAPYEIEYDSCSGDSDDISSDSGSDLATTTRRTPALNTRIKLVSHKTPKSATHRQNYSAAMIAAAAANAAVLMNPPPENAVIGSKDAPWLRLTNYELAKLRKRMKKSTTWTPSDTMVARELKALGRGPEEYHEARRQAEETGKAFIPIMPSPVVDETSGTPQLPAGALSTDTLAVEGHPTSNRGMKLNEAKKFKREALAKLAAEEAEESARKMAQAAKLFLDNGATKVAESVKESGTAAGKARTNARSNIKRKREAEGESTEPVEANETSSRSLPKRTKTETHVPLPQYGVLSVGNGAAADATGSAASVAAGGTVVVTQQLETPVPIPLPSRTSSARSSGASLTSTVSTTNTMIMSIPTNPPASETPVPLPRTEQKKAPVHLTPLVTRDGNRRETRGDAVKRNQQQPSASAPQDPLATSEQQASRAQTPVAKPGPESAGGRRPGSRGTVVSQEPGPSLAADRQRRTSTARNTPVPELKQPPKRAKRPAPGVVSTTSSGGNSAVGKRKAAPKRKARTAKKDKGQVVETEMEEVDDEGNTIDPEEPRYCLCNRVSFGTMIQCDNVDVSSPSRWGRRREIRPAKIQVTQLMRSKQNCKQEWFHLECVGLSDIPARTTRWYCPDCRWVLNIGERGEVSARGVKK